MPDGIEAERGSPSAARAAELFGRIAKLHQRKDEARVATTFTEDAVYHDDGWPLPVRGHAEVRRFLGSIWHALPDFSVQLTDGPYPVGDGQVFAARGRFSGTLTGPLDPPGIAPTGREVLSEFAGFYEFEGERLRYGRIITDTGKFAVQVGVLPEPGSRAERAALWLQRLQARRLRRRAG